MSKFPLIEQYLGLNVYDSLNGFGKISVNDLEAILAKGQVVYAEYSARDTHTALLLNIKPIEKVTAESLLKDLVKAQDAFGISGLFHLSLDQYQALYKAWEFLKKT